MWTGIRINTDGSLATVEIDDATPALQAGSINEAIGSQWYDVLPFGYSLGIFTADEDGQRRFPLNVELSVMVRATSSGKSPLVYGPGIFLGINEETGETFSLTNEDAATIVTMWRRPRAAYEYDAVRASAGLALTA
ncbi:hypothetical protein [Agromyces cerinus]|uniref:Uncharacterized protein n=1 Tax=Agromyces cerinus subsp. cerinus TaxID=232089 RepID=A0A1N6IEQ0_9MICO|nr:hypothetical protein [Agromyces cerinus]SIO30488.1 hypothetical protein SAMN05443544_3953 [Agromyces cerinus subsp. cerinus]